MDRVQIIDALICLNDNNPLDCEGDIIQLLECNLHITQIKINVPPEDIHSTLSELIKFNPSDNSEIWKYLTCNFYLLHKLKISLDTTPPDDVLSVQQNNALRKVLHHIAGLGIRCNLLGNLPQYLKQKSESFNREDDAIIKQCNRLLASTYFLTDCIKCKKLRTTIISESFQAILNSLYQISYGPLKKPSAEATAGFKMSQETYDRLVKVRQLFKTCLDYCFKSIHKSVYAKETMILLGEKSPMWFQKAVSANLTKILLSEKGVETITLTLLDNSTDYDPTDSTKSWKTLDVVIKLIMSLKTSQEFHGNICNQLENLLPKRGPFEDLFVASIKTFYKEDIRAFDRLIQSLFDPLLNLTLISHNADLTESIVKSIRMLHSSFIVTNVNYPELPLQILAPYLVIFFRLYSVTITSNLCDLNQQISQILVKYLHEFQSTNVEMYDVLLFNRPFEGVLLAKPNLSLEIKNERIQAKLTDAIVKSNMNQLGDDLIKLLRNDGDLLMGFFIYLLKCLSDKDKYFKIEANKDLLHVEDEIVLDAGIERNLLVYNLLSNLSDNKNIQNHINMDPSGVIDYINSVIATAIDSNLHMTKEVESDAFQSVFVTVMILQALVVNCGEDNLCQYEKLLEPLRHILTQCLSDELRQLVGEIVQVLEKGGRFMNGGRKFKEVTELDKAIEDVCDPLLPIRGHGLMVLGKLLRKKDKHAMERKMFILNVFQQNLKNEDSYIYLAAIKGLSAMGDAFPDTVLKILTEEYSDFNRKDIENGNEVRMKIGEVLVRVIKNLGELATKYKSLLLNTFLAGSKDDDHLIRASSLSSLGEVCRVLGYKLGTILAEVLVCVHAVITTDKSVEARRAAVTVIRQLFAGLERDMLTVLKDDILEIYRTLKKIYQHDPDDVMRLQAQLALEELNENMKIYVFAKPQLLSQKI